MTSFEGIDNKYKLKNNLKDLMYGRELKECYQLEAYYITVLNPTFKLKPKLCQNRFLLKFERKIQTKFLSSCNIKEGPIKETSLSENRFNLNLLEKFKINLSPCVTLWKDPISKPVS